METRTLESEAERRDVVPILRQLWADRSPEAVLEWTGRPDYHLFGRYDGGEPVAAAGALRREFLHHEPHAWLYDLVVDEDRRGEGHGTALVEHVEEWARDRDCEYLALATPTDNEDARAFYADLGYDEWGCVIEREL